MTHAQANYNMTMARVRAIDTETNRRQLENYYDAKEMNQAYRDSVRKPGPTAADLARFAAAGKPQDLSPSELDSTTGQIAWPVILQSDEFAAPRADLELLFARQAATGQFGAEQHERLQRTTDHLLAELQTHIHEVEPGDYVAAKRFIESLAYDPQRQDG